MIVAQPSSSPRFEDVLNGRVARPFDESCRTCHSCSSANSVVRIGANVTMCVRCEARRCSRCRSVDRFRRDGKTSDLTCQRCGTASFVRTFDVIDTTFVVPADERELQGVCESPAKPAKPAKVAKVAKPLALSVDRRRFEGGEMRCLTNSVRLPPVFERALSETARRLGLDEAGNREAMRVARACASATLN